MLEQTKNLFVLKVISLMLVLMIFVEALPVIATGNLIQNNLTEETIIDELENDSEILLDSTEEAEVYVLGEETSLRTETEKHFRLSNGLYAVAAYEEAVHYLDENGSWQDIDNNLCTSSESGDGFDGVENKNNNVKVKFAKKSNANYLYRVKDGDYSIFVGAYKKGDVSPNKVDVVVSNNSTTEIKAQSSKIKLDEAAELKNQMSKVTYFDLWNNIDLEYVLQGTTIKENIIVNEKADSYSYTFTLKLKNLVPVYNDDKSISLLDSETDKEIYLIPAPYMYDVNGEISQEVEYIIESDNSNNQYLLTIVADKEWIEEETRAWPVTIDPVLIKEGQASDVRDNYVKQGSPNTNMYNSASVLYLGYDCASSVLNERVYTKYNNLPELPSSAIITQAFLYYCQMPAYSPGYSGTDGLVVTAREVLGNWDSTTITWNNQPSFSSTILDYVKTGSNTNGTFLNWDITSTVQKWYDGSLANNGIVLMPNKDLSLSVDMNVRLASSDNTNSSMIPRLIISYRDSKGIEDYWTYESYNCADIGTAYINVFNRNLTFVYNLYQTPGNVLPINLSAVYNSSLANEIGSPNNTVNNNIGLSLGYGTKLNVIEKIYEKTISNRLYYVHEDADGTEHYYYDKDGNGKFVSEDGLDYTITKTGSVYSMKNSEGIIKQYNSSGLISYIQDKYGNKKEFEYSGTNLVSIRDYAAGETTFDTPVTFNVTGNRLNSICGSGNDTDRIEFGYTNDRLTSIKYYSRISGSDVLVNTVEIDYRSDGNIYEIYSAVDDERIIFLFDSDDKIYKIKKVKTAADIDVVLAYQYGDKTVRFRHWGRDEQNGTSDDTYNVYSCDNYGRVISSYVTDNNGKVLGSSTVSYNNAEGTKKHNTVAESAFKNVSSENLFEHSGFEAYTNDSFFPLFSSWMAFSTEEAYIGEPSLKLELTEAITTGGITFDEAGTYCFSAYVKTINVTGTPCFYLWNANDEDIANIKAYFPTGTTNEEIENGWQRIYFTVDIEAPSSYLLYLESNGTGTAYIDCMQFEKGSAPSKYNLMEWTPNTSGTVAVHSTYSEASYPVKKAWSLNGDLSLGTNNTSSVTQIIPVNRPGSDTYVLSFWAQSNSVRLGNTSETDTTERKFNVKVNINYTDNTTTSDTHDINPQNRSVQFVTMPIVPDASKTVKNITIICTYSSNANISYVGDFSLTLEPAQCYTYDDEGNVKTVSTATGESMLNYASNNLDLLKSILPNGDEYTFTYADSEEGVKADVLSVTNKNGVNISYEYDIYGNITETTAGNTNGGTTYTNSYEYSDKGNYLTSTTDSKGNTTTNTYNYNNGVLLSTLSPAGRKSYNYLNNGLLSQVIQDNDNDHVADANEAFVEYSYNGRLLTQINKGNLKYAFTYNNLGLTSKIAIDGRTTPLASYTYSNGGGYINKMEYGNGDYVEYSYDNLGRLIAVSYDGVKTYEYIYNNNGDLYCTKDLEKGITYISEYDTLGRLIRMRETTESGELLYVENAFDQYGRATKTTFNYGGLPRCYQISYKEYSDIVKSVSLPNGSMIEYTHDHLERLNGTAVKDSSGNNVYAGSTYEYSSGNGNNTTSDTVDKVTLNVTNTQYSYVYDDCNNITEIYKNNTLIRKYLYDDLQQMTREIIIAPGATTGTQYDYVYDLYGNILSKTESTYTVATGSTSASATTQYAYADNTWKDLLTSYGDLTYTYDEIGNVTSEYKEGSSSTTYYNWGKGRQLENISYGISAENANVVVAYGYNFDGIRISKTFNEGGLEFIVDGNKILKQIGCGIGAMQTLEFYYDAFGDIIGFRYGENDYYYGKNAQGDVVELYHDGTLIATYEYDAWGRVLSVKDANGTLLADNINSTHVAAINPIRYRGYYYDIEKGMYYLNSRYYNPKVGRFINADGLSYLGIEGTMVGYNLFAYCVNISTYSVYGNIFLNQALNYVSQNIFDSVITDIFIPELEIYYNVPIYNQNGYSLCWAFCQVMIEDYQEGRIRTNSQATDRAIEISISVNGSNWNQGGWPTNASNVFGECGKKTPSLEQLFYTLVNKGPVYAYYGGSDGAHLVVVTGINLNEGLIYTNNPWGIADVQSYDEFLYGFVGMPSNWDMPFGFLIFPY